MPGPVRNRKDPYTYLNGFFNLRVKSGAGG